MDKRTAPIFVVIVMTILVLVVVGGAYFTRFVLRSNVGDNIGPTACTQEAKLCPDGTSVGRTGPNCEFAACPPSANKPASENGTSTPSLP